MHVHLLDAFLSTKPHRPLTMQGEASKNAAPFLFLLVAMPARLSSPFYPCPFLMCLRACNPTRLTWLYLRPLLDQLFHIPATGFDSLSSTVLPFPTHSQNPTKQQKKNHAGLALAHHGHDGGLHGGDSSCDPRLHWLDHHRGPRHPHAHLERAAK